MGWGSRCCCPGRLDLLCVLALLGGCLLPVCRTRVYTNHWAVKIAGGFPEADRIASKYGFINIGQARGLELEGGERRGGKRGRDPVPLGFFALSEGSWRREAALWGERGREREVLAVRTVSEATVFHAQEGTRDTPCSSPPPGECGAWRGGRAAVAASRRSWGQEHKILLLARPEGGLIPEKPARVN
ncbi:hypothetical protein P7K49_000779 [Saguinus oedipus]|uniref:Peptidase S8 pro-domain domain-containing protein n=1 Tax=Saguinus oedipus TaxID=9490 RepID=A0ABQ9WF86_SAGOE|nr:hypothetical protein P7K49_000779 [Saguinus oedipus]